MRLLINGEAKEVDAVTTVAQLLDALVIEGVKPGRGRIAIELNGDIVPRSTYDSRSIADGDRLEIVQAVGGG